MDHIAKIEAKFNMKFPFAPPKTQFDSRKLWVKTGEVEEIDEDSEPEEGELEMDVPESMDSQDDLALKIEEESENETKDSKSSSKKSRVRQRKSMENKPVGEFVARGESSDVEEKILIKSATSPDPIPDDINKSSPVSDAPKPLMAGNKLNPRTSFNKKTMNKNRGVSDLVPSMLPPPLTSSTSQIPSLDYAFTPSSGVGSPFSMANIEVDDGLEESQDVEFLKNKIKSLTMALQEERKRCIHVIQTEKDRTSSMITQMKMTNQKEKDRNLREHKAKMVQLEAQHQTSILEVKRHQWCANCFNEAVYYCCWNTSYCGYDCQNNHWVSHMNTCQQSRQPTNSPVSRM